MKSYSASDVLRVAKRVNNPRRPYLLVNPLQGKHMPVSPAQSLQMMRTLGTMLAQKYPDTKLVVGFAETATAIGAAVTSCFPADCRYIHTTREEVPAVEEWIEFREEHSHATEQKLSRAGFEAGLNGGTILFIEDEISTGRTLCNMARQLRTLVPQDAPVQMVAASIINRVSPENEQLLAEAGIRLECLVRIPEDDYAGEMARCNAAPAAEVQRGETPLTFTTLKCTGGYPDPRMGTDASGYAARCREIAQEAAAQLAEHCGKGARILVLGTEECMYPALAVGEALEAQGFAAFCHATTRSPIGVSDAPEYPITVGYHIASFYEAGRNTFIYDLQAYDAALIVSDTAADFRPALADLAWALAQHGTQRIFYLGCG